MPPAETDATFQPPQVEDLLSPSPRVADAAWRIAFPRLKFLAMNCSRRMHRPGTAGEHDHEEIASQTLRDLWPKIPSLKTWPEVERMTQFMARRRVYDRWRSQKRKPEDITDQPPDEPFQTPPPPQISAGDLRGMIDTLTPPAPALLKLRLAGLKHREIAEKLGMPKGTVDYEMSRAFSQLRQLLEEESTP